jgi:hypothetical protein
LLIVSNVPGAAHEEAPLDLDLETSVEVLRFQLPVELRGNCDGIANQTAPNLAKAFEVSIGDAAATVESIDPIVEDPLHVLVIDASMYDTWQWVNFRDVDFFYSRPTLDNAIRFVEAYAERVLSGGGRDRVMVVTTADDLRHIVGPTRRAEEVARRLGDLTVGYGVRFFDTMVALYVYLESLPQTKDIVVLTGWSGCGASWEVGGSARVRAPMARTEDDLLGTIARSGGLDARLFWVDMWFNMSVIRSGRERRLVPGLFNPRVLAAAGGGESFQVDDPDQLSVILDRILEISSRTRVLLTLAVSREAVEGGASTGPSWDRVKVRSTIDGCRARPVRREIQTTGARGVGDDLSRVSAETTVVRDDEGRPVRAVRLAGVYEGSAAVLRERFDGWDEACVEGEGGAFRLAEYVAWRPGRVEMCVEDDAKERWLLAVPGRERGLDGEWFPPRTAVHWESRKEVVYANDRSSRRVRHVGMEVDDLEELKGSVRTPGEVMLKWLGEGSRRSFLGGDTYLWTRAHLASALFDFEPGYREWAMEKARGRSGREGALEGAVAEEEGRREAPGRFATWLGDVSMREAFEEADRILVGRFLAEGERSEGIVREWRGVAEEWAWPDRYRTIVPMVLAWEAEREEIGLWRFLTPSPVRMLLKSGRVGRHPRIAALREDDLPRWPYGLLTVEAMRAGVEGIDPVWGRLVAERIEYESASGAEPRVRIGFRDGSGDRTIRGTVTVRFGAGAGSRSAPAASGCAYDGDTSAGSALERVARWCREKGRMSRRKERRPPVRRGRSRRASLASLASSWRGCRRTELCERVQNGEGLSVVVPSEIIPSIGPNASSETTDELPGPSSTVAVRDTSHPFTRTIAKTEPETGEYELFETFTESIDPSAFAP